MSKSSPKKMKIHEGSMWPLKNKLYTHERIKSVIWKNLEKIEPNRFSTAIPIDWNKSCNACTDYSTTASLH